jgi:hypothetical protein
MPFRPTNHCRAVGPFLGLAALAAVAGCRPADPPSAGNPMSLVGPEELQRPPNAQVVAEAKQVHRVISPAVAPFPRNYLARLGTRIVKAAGAAYPVLNRAPWADTEFLLVRDKQVNVSTAGGKYVYVYAGLVAACEQEEDLAAALCHAFAHLALKHAEAAAGTPVDGPAVNPSADPLDKLLYVRFAVPDALPSGYFPPARHQVADRVAFDIYVKAGWDPRKFLGSGRLARRASMGSMPMAGVTPERGELTTDVETFNERRAAVAAMPAATGRERDVLDLLPGCYGEVDPPERRAARDALAARVRPVVVPEAPPIIPQ